MPSVYQEARSFQTRAEALDSAALVTLAREMDRALPGLLAQAEAAATRLQAMRASGEAPGELHLFAVQRSRAIAQQLAAEIERLMRWAGPGLSLAQREAMQAGIDAARALVDVQLPAGSSLGANWQQVNIGAVQAAVAAQQGATLGELLDALGPDAGRLARDKLTAGLVAGKSPRTIARDLRQVTDLAKSRAEAIARTETLRAYRTGSLEAYRRNGITRYRRLAAHSARTCAMCLAMDGEVQESETVMAVHVNDRCAVVPIVTVGGISTAEPRTTGAEWFGQQPADVQRRILGPGGLEAYQKGMPLRAFAHVHDDPAWGPTLRRVPNGSLTRPPRVESRPDTESIQATAAQPAKPRKFASNEEALDWGKRQWPDAKDTGFTAAEVEALKRYQSSGYQRVNPMLRGQTMMSEAAKERVRTELVGPLDKALARQPAKEAFQVIRAVHLDAFPDRPDRLVGKALTDKGYMSTALRSTPPADFRKKPVLMNITVPEGTPSYFLYHTAPDARMRGEREVLLGRDTTYVIRAAREVRGKWELDVEIVPKTKGKRR